MKRNQKNYQYYPAVLAYNAVWVSPQGIDRAAALGIMMMNNSHVGVFAVSASYARGLCHGLGGYTDPETTSTAAGFWWHYHPVFYRKAHCWYIE